MNCPVCGLEPLSDQKFCRKCGASLQHTTQPLAELTVETSQGTTQAMVREGVTNLTGMLVRTGFIMMFVGVMLGITGKKLFDIDILTVIGVLLAVVGIFMIGYASIFPSPRRRREAVPLPHPVSLKPAEPTKKLSPMNDIDFVPTSVTEGTTDLLKTPAVSSTDN